MGLTDKEKKTEAPACQGCIYKEILLADLTFRRRLYERLPVVTSTNPESNNKQ